MTKAMVFVRNTERKRQLEKMHIHFARAVYRWLNPTPEFTNGPDDYWEARAHVQLAVTHLKLAQLEPTHAPPGWRGHQKR